MSLLANAVYANPSTPCWVSSGGGTISGDLTVTGDVSAAGEVTAGLGVITNESPTGAGFVVQDATLTDRTVLNHVSGMSARSLLQTNDPLYFTQVGQLNGNTSLTLSAFSPTPTDALNVGGSVTARKLNLFVGFGGTIGSGSIAVASSSVVINTSAVTAISRIILTRNAAPVAGPTKGGAQGIVTYDPVNIVPGVSFQVDLVDIDGVTLLAADVPAEFQYLIIN